MTEDDDIPTARTPDDPTLMPTARPRVHEAGMAIEERLRDEVRELEQKAKGASGPLKDNLELQLVAKRRHLRFHVERGSHPDVEPSDPHRRTRAEIDAETSRLRR